jgi:hypothetical protein
VKQVQTVLARPDLGQAMTEHNYNLAKKFFSYRVLQQQLEGLLIAFFGEGNGDSA